MGKPVRITVGAVLIGVLAWSGIDTIAANIGRGIAEGVAVAEQLPSYPLDTCVVTGVPLAEGALDLVHEGRLVRLASTAAAEAFLEDPSPYFARLDSAVITAQRDEYPMRTCLVGKKPLGSMGEIIEHVHGTRLVRFCCDGCIKPFELKAALYLQELDAHYVAAQKDGYALETCVVTGIPLGNDALDYLYGTTLVRLADDAALEAFLAAPQKYLR